MYIGPWQEYKLSKANSRPPVINQSLKSEIEKAIIDSLDYESAQIALTAINPYFDLSANNGLPPRPKLLPTIDQISATNKQGRSLRSNLLTRLPNVNIRGSANFVYSARNMSAASPASVRSTQSEPIGETFPQIKLSGGASGGSGGSKSSSARAQVVSNIESPIVQKKMNLNASKHGTSTIKTFQTESEQEEVIVDTNTNFQPSVNTYNAHAVIDLLRKERKSKARKEILKLAGWTADSNTAGKAADSTMGSHIHADSSFSKAPSKDKVEQVQQMKTVYMAAAINNQHNSNGGGSSSGSSMHQQAQPLPRSQSISSYSNINHSNHSNGQLPTIIQDIEINDSVLGKVSKYFTETELTMIGGAEKQRMEKNGDSTTMKQSESKFQISDELSSDELNDAMTNESLLSREDEDLGISSLEGLLKWSSLLDINDI